MQFGGTCHKPGVLSHPTPVLVRWVAQAQAGGSPGGGRYTQPGTVAAHLTPGRSLASTKGNCSHRLRCPSWGSRSLASKLWRCASVSRAQVARLHRACRCRCWRWMAGVGLPAGVATVPRCWRDGLHWCCSEWPHQAGQVAVEVVASFNSSRHARLGVAHAGQPTGHRSAIT